MTDITYRTKPDAGRPIVIGATGKAALAPVTIPTGFKETVNKHGSRVALRVKRNNAWKEWTFQQYHDSARQAARALISLGLPTLSTVGILGFNSPEWLFAFQGTIMAGGIGFGIYTTNAPDACHFVLSHANAFAVVVENNVQLRKVLEIRSKLPNLKYIIQYLGQVKEEDPSILSWEAFMAKGAGDTYETALNERIGNIRPENAAAIVYTSGTTGNPKGAMLTHDNIAFTVRIVAEPLAVDHTDHLISFLPLSHVAAMMIDIMAGTFLGNTVSFAQPDALKGTLGDTLKDVRPTAFLGVPRVWEKIAEQMQVLAAQNGSVKRSISKWAKKKGLSGNLAEQEGKGKPSGWWLANKLVFSKVKKALGLDRCKGAYSGAAPIALSTLHYFLSLNIPIFEIYGMSETSAIITLSCNQKYKTGSCGFVPQDLDVKVMKADADGNGEVCVRGRNVMLGYLDDEEANAKDFDSDGYFHTGDIGKIDPDGYLRITGRIKELVITAGGENIAPTPIENAIKANMPFVSNAMAIGDKRKFIVVLLTVKCVFDDEGNPTDALTRQCIMHLEEIGFPGQTKVSEIIKNQAFLQYIETAMVNVNKSAISNAAAVKKWAFCPVDFSVPGNELGPTLKLKRRVIHTKYAELIDSLYV